MARIAHLKKGLIDFLSAELIHSGFKPSPHALYRPIPMGRQILHLSFPALGAGIEVVPSLAVRHEELEKLYHQLLDQPVNIESATVGTGYGDLGMGESLSWRIFELDDILAAGKEILMAFWKAEKPFFERFPSLERIYAELQKDTPEADKLAGTPHLRAQKLLLAAYLLGNVDDFDRLIDERIGYLTESDNPYLASFLEFAARFRRFVREAH